MPEPPGATSRGLSRILHRVICDKGNGHNRRSYNARRWCNDMPKLASTVFMYASDAGALTPGALDDLVDY